VAAHLLARQVLPLVLPLGCCLLCGTAWLCCLVPLVLLAAVWW
jgi:hypothetical protein